MYSTRQIVCNSTCLRGMEDITKSNQNLPLQLESQPQPLNEIKKRRSWWPCIPPIHPPPPPLATSSTTPPPHLWPVHKLPATSPVAQDPLLSTTATSTTPHMNLNESSTIDSPPQRRPYYLGIFLAGPSKTRLLQRYPPLHARVYAHHVTLHHFSGSASIETDVEMCLQETFPLGAHVAAGVDGGAADERTQALKVTLPTWIPYKHTYAYSNDENGSDGKLKSGRRAVAPHVTVSIVEEASAKEAGEMISSLASSSLCEPVHGLRVLHGVVGVCLTDRTVVYSKEELIEAVFTAANNGTALLEDSEDDDEDFGNYTNNKVVVEAENQRQEQQHKEEEEPGSMMINLVDLFHAHFAPLAPLVAATTIPSEESSPSINSAAAAAASGSTSTSSNGLHSLSRTPPAWSGDHQNNNSNGRDSRLQHPPRSKRSRSRTEIFSGKNRNQNKSAWWQQQAFTSTQRKSNGHVCVQASTESIDTTTTADISTTTAAATALFLLAAETERDSMQVHHAAHRAAWHASHASQAQGDGISSRIHAASAKRHAIAAVSARRRASAVAFAARNSSNLNSFKVDLHGMHVQEALRVLHRYVQGLNDLRYPGGILLKVVTGYGRHSADNKAKILPSVVKYFCESGFLFDVEEDNPGVVRVLLEPDGLGLL